MDERHYANWCRANKRDPACPDNREHFLLLQDLLSEKSELAEDLEKILAQENPKKKAAWKWTYLPEYDTVGYRYSRLQWLYIVVHTCAIPFLILAAGISFPIWVPICFILEMRRSKKAIEFQEKLWQENVRRSKAQRYTAEQILSGDQPVPIVTVLKIKRCAEEGGDSGIWSAQLLDALSWDNYVVDPGLFAECVLRVPEGVWSDEVNWTSEVIALHERAD